MWFYFDFIYYKLQLLFCLFWICLLQLYEVADDEEGHPKLTLTVPREHASGFVNNKRENYKFRYTCFFIQLFILL